MSAATVNLEPPTAPTDDRAPRLALQSLCLTLARRVVLDDLTLEVRPGEIFGVLGPNGSGKTSMLRCLAGVLRPDRGTIRLDGRLLEPHYPALRAPIGVVFQDPSLDPKLTVRENLLLGAALFAVRGAEAQRRADELLTFMELSSRRDDPAGILSGGSRRRLELARALISQPRLLLLDEPTTGLDMVAFDKVWFLLEKLRELQDLAVLVSTHRADEAERCDRLAIVDRGHVVAADTPARLLDRLPGDVVVIEADKPAPLAEQLRTELGLHARVVDGRVHVEEPQGHTLIPRLVEALPPGRIASIALRRPSLTDAFFHLTGRSFAEAELGTPG